MKKWPNIWDRIKERLLALGYRQENGRPDVMGFAFRHEWNHVYIFRWIGGSTPDYDNIIKLSGQLDVSPSWLMFGEQGTLVPARSPKSAGSVAASPAPPRVVPRKNRKVARRDIMTTLPRAA
jgi:hypothetical protein